MAEQNKVFLRFADETRDSIESSSLHLCPNCHTAVTGNANVCPNCDEPMLEADKNEGYIEEYTQEMHDKFMQEHKLIMLQDKQFELERAQQIAEDEEFLADIKNFDELYEQHQIDSAAWKKVSAEILAEIDNDLQQEAEEQEFWAEIEAQKKEMEKQWNLADELI